MALFKKNNATAAERDLDALRHRKALLEKQREIAESALEKAVADRRRILLESDLDQNGGQREPVALIERLKDENEAVTDALAVIDQKIADAEARVAAEKDETARQREAEKRQAGLAAARNMLDRFREISTELVDALALLRSCGPACAAAHGNLEYFARELPGGIQAAFIEVEGYCAMVAGGNVPIRAEVVAPQTPPPAPAIERRVIVCLQASKWFEPDGTIRTAGKLSQAHVPITIAEQAVAIDNALPVDSDAYKRLREFEPVDHAPQLERDCYWLDQPRFELKPAEVHVTEPPVHSALAPPPVAYQGAAIVGTATAQRTR